jgi:hypothetical protein
MIVKFLTKLEIWKTFIWNLGAILVFNQRQIHRSIVIFLLVPVQYP